MSNNLSPPPPQHILVTWGGGVGGGEPNLWYNDGGQNGDCSLALQLEFKGYKVRYWASFQREPVWPSGKALGW